MTEAARFLAILMEWLQPVGIIASLAFSGVALRNDIRSRRTESHLRITEGHREIWSALLSDSRLERVLRSDLDLASSPVTPEEDRLVRFVLNHIFLTFESRRAKLLGDIGDFDNDIADFLALPIPKTVWKQSARFQPLHFRKFIERLILSRETKG